VSALDWSQDGRWLALATPRGVYIFRVADWTSLVRIPLVTQDLAWR
jgi:hypothetical protein